jgi:hypothetical protein
MGAARTRFRLAHEIPASELMPAARCLYEIMERLDPTDDSSWEALTAHQHEFYRCCVKELIGSGEFMALMSGPTTT